MKTIAIITARGGSKRIPRKNIKPFCGRPIMTYSIQAALDSGVFDEVMVSTDDTEIAGIAAAAGAKVPFLRSAETSNDYATTADVLLEVIGRYRGLGNDLAYACVIYPTAPFVTAAKLRHAHGLIVATGCDSVIPVVRFSYPIQRALKIEGGRLAMIWPENLNARSQELTPVYHDSGQFYFLNVAAFLEQKKLFAAHTVPMELLEIEVQDIDTEQDWKIAEMKYRMLKDGQTA